MKVGTLLLVASDTISYLKIISLLDDQGNLTAPSIQQDLLIAAFIEESVRKHTAKSVTGKSAVSISPDNVNAVMQIVQLLLSIFGKK